MAKTEKVTDDDIQSLVRDIELFVSDAQDFADRIQHGHCEAISGGPEVVRALTVACRNFSELSVMVMAQGRRQEMDAELAELRKRAGQ